MASLRWVTVQQDPHKSVARKLGINPGIVERLEIHPLTKAAIRWNSIALGVIVPALVLIDFHSEEEGEKRTNLLDLAFAGLGSMAECFDGSG